MMTHRGYPTVLQSLAKIGTLYIDEDDQAEKHIAEFTDTARTGGLDFDIRNRIWRYGGIVLINAQ